MNCWKLLHRRLGHQARRSNIRFKLIYRYMYHSFLSPNTSRVQRPHLLLYGAVAFAWERERISNELVMSCLTDYLSRFSDSPPRESSTHNDHHHQHKTNNRSSLAPEDSNSPSSIGWGGFQWPFQWPFTSQVSSTSPPPSSSDTPSLSDSSSSWNYLSWAQSIFTWSTTTPPSSSTPLMKTNPHSSDFKEDEDVGTDGFDPKRAKKEQFVRDSIKYYREHSRECKSRLPLVGMARNNETRTFVPRIMDTIGERTKNKLQNIWSKYQNDKCGLDLTLQHSEVNSDLASIGCLLYQHEKGSDENWYRYYMELEQEGVSAPDNYQIEPHHEMDTRKTLFSQVLKYLTGENIKKEFKKVMGTNLEHFQNQFSCEGHHHSNDPSAVAVLQDVMEVTKQTFIDRISDVLDHFYAESLILHRLELNGNRQRNILNDNNKDSVNADRGDGSEVRFGLAENEELHLATDSKMAISNSERKDTTQSGDLSGWEFVTKDIHYVVYKKIYEDTGLFQYKVKGHYDDITASDFCEVQVDQNLRRTWDTYAGQMATVDSDELSNCKLIHWIMKYPFPMSSREYLFVQRSWTSEDKDAIVIMNRSSSHPDFPETGRHVRVRDYFSDMVIKSRSHINELGIEFELTYFDCPRTQLPASCVNWVASTAMPDFMKKIHDAALKIKPS